MTRTIDAAVVLVVAGLVGGPACGSSSQGGGGETGGASGASVGGSAGNTGGAGGATGGSSGSATGGIATGGIATGGIATGGIATGGNATGGSTGGATGCVGAPTLGTVTPAELRTELAQPERSFLLINVHTPVNANIPGTDAELAYSDVPAIEAYLGPDKSRAVTIYCMSDYMALLAGPALVSDGYCAVRYLVGGLSAWQTAGYPVGP